MVAPTYGFFDFRTILQQWAGLGLFDVFLPFLIVFALIYAILHKSKLLGDMSSINAVISCIIAFFVVGNQYVTQLFLPIFSQAGLALAILVSVMIIAGLFLHEEHLSWGFRGIFALFGLGLFLWLLGRMSETYGIWLFPQDFFITNAWWIVPGLMFVLFIAAILWSTKKDEKANRAGIFIPIEKGAQGAPGHA